MVKSLGVRTSRHPQNLYYQYFNSHQCRHPSSLHSFTLKTFLFTDLFHHTRRTGTDTLLSWPASCMSLVWVCLSSFIVIDNCRPAVHDSNRILKYADDTYLVVPAANEDTCESEFMHVYDWAAANNLTLNCTKSKELVFCARGVRGRPVQPPPPSRGISALSLIILGVVADDMDDGSRPCQPGNHWLRP